MHKHNKDKCIILKERINDLRPAFVGKVGLGPVWTLVQALSYEHMLQLFVSTFASSFRHERMSTVRKIYTRMRMQDLITIFNLINYSQQMTTVGCKVDHIHLDKKYIQHTFPKRNNIWLFIN
jgi:hypothetical protein